MVKLEMPRFVAMVGFPHRVMALEDAPLRVLVSYWIVCLSYVQYGTAAEVLLSTGPFLFIFYNGLHAMKKAIICPPTY